MRRPAAALLAACALAAAATTPATLSATASAAAAPTAPTAALATSVPVATAPVAAASVATRSSATTTPAEPKTTLAKIEKQVMCVVCRTPLATANGPQAEAQRRQIRRMIAAGMTEQQIKEALVAEYGQRVLALPDDEGFDLAAYVVPIVAVAAGLVGLALVLPRWRRAARARAAQPAAAPPPLSDADQRRLDEDLAEHD